MPGYFEVRATNGRREAVWRKFLIETNVTFTELHDALALAFCWRHVELLRFQTENRPDPRLICGIKNRFGDNPVRIPAETMLLASYVGEAERVKLEWLWLFAMDYPRGLTLTVRRFEHPDRFRQRLTGGKRDFTKDFFQNSYHFCHHRLDCDPRTEYGSLARAWAPEPFDLATARRRFDR